MKYLRIKVISLVVFTFLYSSELSAQEYNFPLNYYSHLFLESSYSNNDSLVTSSFKALPESWLKLDSVWAYANDEVYYTRANEKLFYDHLFNINEGQLNVSIDLLGTQEYAFEFNDTTVYSDTTRFYHNSRGFLVRGSIGKNLSFESSFMENQVFVPTYMKAFMDAQETYPGGGRAKKINNGGFDFAQSGGYISYSPSKKVNLQFGHGKNFIGNGHRSLLLSDNANNYPYLRGSFQFWENKIRYHTTMATLLNFERLPAGDTPESRFKIKNASFHYLEFSPHPRFNVGLFESIMWKRWDDEIGTLKYNFASANPIIFGHSLLSPNDDVNKSLLGLDLGYQVTNTIKTYGQLLLDNDLKGIQLGVRTHNLFLQNLHVQVEYNEVDPFTYTSSDKLQNYSNQNQELAHPLGADFNELIIRGTYFYKKRIFADLQANFNDRGTDITDENGNVVLNTGNDIFQNNTGEQHLVDYVESRKSTVFTSLTFGYFFNPQSNLNAYLRLVYRSSDKDVIFNNIYQGLTDNVYLRFGIRTSIFNNYDDF